MIMVSERDQQKVNEIIKHLKQVGISQNIKALYCSTNLGMSKLYQMMGIIVDLHPDLVSYDERTKSWKYIEPNGETSN